MTALYSDITFTSINALIHHQPQIACVNYFHNTQTTNDINSEILCHCPTSHKSFPLKTNFFSKAILGSIL